jgi:hypothetical protein
LLPVMPRSVESDTAPNTGIAKQANAIDNETVAAKNPLSRLGPPVAPRCATCTFRISQKWSVVG